MHRVAVAVTAGMPLFEIAVPCEVFGNPRPDLIKPAYDLILCPVSGQRTTVGGAMVVEATHTLDELVAADTVVVPALRSYDADIPAALIAALRAASARGARIAAICTGAFALAEAGLLDGQRATTHWMYAAELASRYRHIDVDANVLYTTGGRMESGAELFTSAGTAAGLDLCLELVRRDHGSAVAADLARRLVVPPHRQGGQSQYVTTPLPRTQRSNLAQAIDWTEANLAAAVTLKDIAAVANMSTRTLSRQFYDSVGMAPMQWLASRRIARAQLLLETTDLTMDRIALESGLGSATNLRRQFLRQTSVTPGTYRKLFGQRSPQSR